MKIGVFCPNWVGDLVMATPALRSLRNEYPQAEIVAILRPHLAAVLDGLSLVDRVLVDPQGGGNNLWAGLRFAHGLRSESFDLVLLLTNSFRTGLWAWLAGGRRRVGFEGNLRSLLLTDRVPRRSRRDPHPVLPEYLRLAEAAGCRQLVTETELAVTEADEQELEAFWRTARPAGRPARVVCLNPGGAFGAAKHWPTEYFAELARRLVDDLSVEVLVLCGPAERQVAQDIVRLAERPRVHSLAHVRPSIGLSKAAIRHCDLLVTTDSGPRHFAAPFDRPAITLFGPTHPAWSETNHPRAVGLQHPVECGPCQQRTCPLGHHACLRELHPARVFAVARNLLLAQGHDQAGEAHSARAA
jgi:heptosyltransferase-2